MVDELMFQTYCCRAYTAYDHLASETELARAWNGMNWKVAREIVFRLQCRIARAALERRTNVIRELQDELVSMPEAKMLAVRDVTRKKSRNTRGTDGIVWQSPAEKMYAAYHLNGPGYSCAPLRRVYIPKDKPGKFRPLGIASMNDRAVQKLYSYALQPVAETRGDRDSFGYRLFRSVKDACAAVKEYLSGMPGPVYVLDADIAACFDRISHPWLMQNIPLDKDYLRKVLNAGIVYHGKIWRPDRGVPQGGIISPLLANMTLDGLEPILIGGGMVRPEDEIRHIEGMAKGRGDDVSLVRYADDMVILCSSQTAAEESVETVSTFLRPRGLYLSQEKTRIVQADSGFDFLHWHFRTRGQDVSVSPSVSSQRHMHQKVQGVFFRSGTSSPGDLIRRLNSLLRGFAFYHREVDTAVVFS